MLDRPLIISELTWPEFEEAVRRGVRTALIPLGSTEEHGFHLPLETDAAIAYHVAVEAARQVEVFVTPPIAFGLCRSTAAFPGTLTISIETLQRLVEETCLSLRRHGVRNLALLAAHAGSAHLTGLELAAQRLVQTYPDLRIALVRFPDVIREKLPIGLLEDPSDMHAGEVETSLMLVIKPHLVKVEKAVCEHPKPPKYLVSPEPRQHLSTGVMGDATKASREKGEAILKALVSGVLEAVRMLEASETGKT